RHVATSPQDLACMEAAAHGEAVRLDGVADITRTADRPRRTVEGREDAVARRVDEIAAIGRKRALHGVLEAVEDRPPAAVAELDHVLGGGDHVDDENGCEE